MREPAIVDSRFELLDELGRGGMGVVYRARDRERGGEVALKALRQTSAAELLRLKREFRVMSNVHHPNLVRLGELIERDGGWFFTMELVEGVDFLAWVGAPESMMPKRVAVVRGSTGPGTTGEPTARMADGYAMSSDITEAMIRDAPDAVGELPQPPDVREPPRFHEAKLRAALRDVANALAGLHRAGLVHRDIKPSNIKIDRNGRVVLLDFGVTIPLYDKHSEIAGTFAYMAPEQAAGRATAASDWYAVGVMLFRAMTGYLPFPATREGLELKSRVAAPSPDVYVRGLPADLVKLCCSLLAMNPTERAGDLDVRAVAGHPTGPMPPLRPPALASTVFVGRRREHARLAELLERQRLDLGCAIALVSGPSGVGKSSLVRNFLDEQQRRLPDLVVFESRCDERESVPFNALDGIVDGIARFAARYGDQLPARATNALRSPDAAELRRLFPVLADAAARSTPLAQLSLQSSRVAAARALRELLAAIGETRPLMLVIEDAQWADADSHALLVDVLAAPPPPLLLLATARTAEPPQLLSGIAVDTEHVALAGLEPDEAVELVSAVAANTSVDAAAIVREAAGHPMFIAELSRFATERRAAAGSLDDALWSRACSLRPPARRLLHVVAVDGAVLPRAVAVTAAELAAATADEAIAELRAARFIGTGDNVVEPYHARVREAVVGRLTTAERSAVHLAVAQTLDAHGAPPERIAHHWHGAGEHERAAQCAEAAAARAAYALAFERAAEWLAMALELATFGESARRALIVKRAEALMHAGRPRDAALAFLDASRCGELTTIEHRDLRRRAAECFLGAGYVEEGLDVAREVLAEIGVAWPKTRAAALRALVWQHVRLGTTRLRWQQRAESEVAPERLVEIDTCWSLCASLTLVDSLRSVMFNLRAARLALDTGEPRRLALALSAAAFAAACMNQQRWLRRITTALARLDASSAVDARCYLAIADAGRTYFTENDWPGTAEVAKRGLDAWIESGRGHTWEVDLFEQFIGFAHGTACEHAAAAEHATRVVRDARRRGDRFLEVGFRAQFPQPYLLADRVDDGIRDVMDALASWRIPDGMEKISNPFYWAFRSRIMLATYGGRIEEDAQWIDDAWRSITSSLLWHVPAIRLDGCSYFAGFMIARAVHARRAGSSEARKYIARAKKLIRTIERSPLPARGAAASTLRAFVLDAEGNTERAIPAFRDGIAQLDQFNFVGMAYGARWRLGRLLGGSEGAALIEEAQAWLRGMHAVRPDRLAGMLVSTFDS